MSKYAINDTTLTAIADSIRAKGGTSDPIQVSNFASAIANLPTGGGDITAEDLAFTGNLGTRFCSGQIGRLILNNYKDLMTFTDITGGQQIFGDTDKQDLSSLTINADTSSGLNFQALFQNSDIIALPKLVGKIANNSYTQYPFGNMSYIREILSSVYEGLDTSLLDAAQTFGLYNGFQNMYSLKKYPEGLVNKFKAYSTNNMYAGYYSLFSYDYVLEEVTNLFINPSVLTSNSFNSTFTYCGRVNKITFETNSDGTAKSAQWKSQTIDCSVYTGWSSSNSYITGYNSGITEEKSVIDDATYQALKNDPDWYSTNKAYSRYNHDSAVATINSLPDTSAYLATAGGTNTIKFNGDAGSATDGGAINTLTEEEIAVATAKGWTVAFT